MSGHWVEVIETRRRLLYRDDVDADTAINQREQYLRACHITHYRNHNQIQYQNADGMFVTVTYHNEEPA